MNILVTGGAGFIGSHTADALIKNGHCVRLLDNLQKNVHPHGKPDYISLDAEFLVGDVREKETWQQALDGMDAVYHLAAYQDYLTDFSTFFHVNTVSTALLYEVLVNDRAGSKIRKVIVAASQAVMGEGRYTCPCCHPSGDVFVYPRIRSEAQLSQGEWDHRCRVCHHVLQWLPSDESVIHPCNQYALSKFSQEQIAIELGKRYHIPSVVMRYSIVQGPRQSFYNAYSGAMRIFALSLLTNKPPLIFEDGRQIRDFVNIFDVVAANLIVLENSRADYEVFNVGGGIAWSVLAFYEAMQQITNRKLAPRLAGHYRYGDTRHIFSDITKMRSLGWAPTRSVEESIRTYWTYLQRHEGQKNFLEYAETHMKQLQIIRQSRSFS